MMLSWVYDSAIPMPSVFMFEPGTHVVVNQNVHRGIKLVNGASYTALDVIPDKAHPGHRVGADTILHFGPPVGIPPTSETTRDLNFVGMTPSTIFPTPISTRIEPRLSTKYTGNTINKLKYTDITIHYYRFQSDFLRGVSP